MNLHGLFDAIATAPTEPVLRSRFMDHIDDHFQADRWGIYLFNDQKMFASSDVHGVSEAFVDRYEQVGRAVDPVLQYVQKYHAPAHEQLVLPPGGWKQSQLYRLCCSEYDHEHIMTGPVLGQGQLTGTLHFARGQGKPAFNGVDIAKLSAVCTHISLKLASLRSPPLLARHGLTTREQQIADLVAKGLTNAQIGAELWITQNTVKQSLKRMFRKLEVSARAELVAKLSQPKQ
ncbi:Transcriptional regulatory protein LiaR [Acaryochloris thomasi RCC1774]|uniref:Transcriptional regulatory protein LiaR n=1 Tax=Acaryochloris thomasi RCC1774 TaxID=1764569 RepID=A0A2W1JD06_9CYAN|nr:LuxR C-terminal-related transcriptional regulator [Acaryochloris thomasi]PZD71668.1 Transcriptional regulatory protein LiaR [Acaryochloris thomasi RCC1774]